MMSLVIYFFCCIGLITLQVTLHNYHVGVMFRVLTLSKIY